MVSMLSWTICLQSAGVVEDEEDLAVKKKCVVPSGKCNRAAHDLERPRRN